MLTQPLVLASGLTLKNRLAKAALTESLAGEDHRPSERLLRYTRTLSEGGVGLAITGNVMVDRRHLERAGNVAIEDGRHLAELTSWAEAASAGGAAALVQLSHPGRQSNRFTNQQPVAPSAVAAIKTLRAFKRPRALQDQEIRELIERFARSAEIVRRAGFAGVQVHSAHGYLLSQFLSPLTNLRSDQWGGSLQNRVRLLREIVRAVRGATTRSFTLAVKLNSADFQRGGFGEDEALEVVRWLAEDGVDLIEISGGNYEAPALLGRGVASSTAAREAYFLEFARQVRGVSRVPLLLTGGFRSLGAMESALAEDACDLIGLGRPLLLEPDLPRRLLAGQALRAVSGPRPLGQKTLSAMFETAYYDVQIARLGRGLPPKRALSLGRALWFYLVRELRGMHVLRGQPRALPAARDARTAE